MTYDLRLFFRCLEPYLEVRMSFLRRQESKQRSIWIPAFAGKTKSYVFANGVQRNEAISLI